MMFSKPEMEVVRFNAADIIVTSPGSCSWDCNNQTCSNVCTSNECPPVSCGENTCVVL